MSDIGQQLAKVEAQIRQFEQRHNRPIGQTSLLAVSKTKPADRVLAAYLAGQRSFGENQLQDAMTKLDDPRLSDLALDWHFIGPLQSNKTKTVAERFSWLHSLDRIRVATRLSAQRPATLAPLNVCIQVNISAEQSKSGLSASEVPDFAAQIAQLPNIKLRGLMSIPAPSADFESQRLPFRRLHDLFEQLRASGHPLDTLSMGMSADMEAAIAEGATWVRIGTAVFGAR